MQTPSTKRASLAKGSPAFRFFILDFFFRPYSSFREWSLRRRKIVHRWKPVTWVEAKSNEKTLWIKRNQVPIIPLWISCPPPPSLFPQWSMARTFVGPITKGNDRIVRLGAEPVEPRHKSLSYRNLQRQYYLSN